MSAQYVYSVEGLNPLKFGGRIQADLLRALASLADVLIP